MIWVKMELLFVSDICRCQGKAQILQVEMTNSGIRLMSFLKINSQLLILTLC